MNGEIKLSVYPFRKCYGFSYSVVRRDKRPGGGDCGGVDAAALPCVCGLEAGSCDSLMATQISALIDSSTAWGGGGGG